jgi:3-oxoacyl-[acyl-carrier protein] reductase
MNKLQNKWALITGSSRGIGQQIALGLAQEGCNIIVHSRKLENTQSTLNLIKPFQIKTLSVSGELGNVTEETSFMNKIIDEIGHVDILYNNAAIMSVWKDSIFSIDQTEWHKIFEVNFFSMVRICNIFIPIMSQRGWGRVINLSSGIKGTPQLAPYSVSKAAVDKYKKDLSSQLKNTNVLVNALDPGWLKTDLGGKNADFEVATVLPGALVPALLENFSESGVIYKAQDYNKTL